MMNVDDQAKDGLSGVGLFGVGRTIKFVWDTNGSNYDSVSQSWNVTEGSEVVVTACVGNSSDREVAWGCGSNTYGVA